jgi:hypothetical protein
MTPRRVLCRGLFLFLMANVPACAAQMVSGADMPGFDEALGLRDKGTSEDFTVQEIAVQTSSKGSSGAATGNVLWPGESAELTLHFANKTDKPLRADGVVQVVRYGTSVPVGEVYVPHVFRIANEGQSPLSVDLPPHGSQDVVVQPRIGQVFGGYALIVRLDGHGSAFAASFVRTVKPDVGRVQYPTYALDTTWDEFMNEGVFTLFEKLGIKGMRMGGPYEPATEPGYGASMKRLDEYMRWAKKHDVTVMLTLGDGDDWSDQPLGRPRPWLSADNKMQDTKDDRAWMPEYDSDFQRWVRGIATKYGWPGGNLNAVELWNEPWESISISGWGADIQRYRDIFTHMALGVEQARKAAGVKVLIGGACSSTNTRDKLFPDGSNRFLKWLDFVSIHYQALAADPSEVPEWMHRKSPYGPVRVWDTESWIANSEDRVAGVIASMRAQGQSRTAGIYDGSVYDSKNVKIGDRTYPVVQAWAPAASVAAMQKFIGQRAFRSLLFQNGLPWVFVFNGLPVSKTGKPNPDDGTVVVLGDLSKIYEPARTLFRSVAVKPSAKMVIANPAGAIHLYDFYGNPEADKQGKIEVPLDGRGFYLRGDGSVGSFEGLLRALRTARITGYDPVEIVAHDLTRPIGEHPVLRLSLTNVLNHPVAGQLRTTLGDLVLAPAQIEVALRPNETRDYAFIVRSGPGADTNSYPLDAIFDGGPDGRAEHSETMHVNSIAHRTITVDGDLSDWSGVLPQRLPDTGVDASLTEKAWLPFKDRSQQSGLSEAPTVYVAYDERNFYFAARIPDSTPDPGMVRFATRDDDSYFYPNTVTTPDGKTLAWPKGLRHYSYRRNFDIPSGTGEHDNVQIAFNVLDRKPWLAHPPGVMPRFIAYWDTDYEYALNPVAAEYGGGTEVWRLQAPGMPRKHFFPRQPKSPVDGGAVPGAALVIWRTATMRFLEASIPWSEMPGVWRRFRSGQTVKFSCRINDNRGSARELATGRSVSKYNSLTFHDDWQTHWANELEFGVEK